MAHRHHRLLFVSVDYPPHPQVGALRVAKLASHLIAQGHDIRVLTATAGTHTPSRDPQTGRVLSALTYAYEMGAVHAVSAPNPFRLAAIGRSFVNSASASNNKRVPGASAADAKPRDNWRLRAGNALRQLLIPDEYAAWVLASVGRGLELIHHERPSAIWAFFPPASSILAGWILSRVSGVPLLVDYRDPWNGFSYWGPKPHWRTALERSLERRILRHSAGVTVVNEGIAEHLRAEFPEVKTVISILPQGVDPRDIAAYAAFAPLSRSDGIVRLIHAGTVSKGTADPEVLIRVCARLRAAGVLSERAVRITFVGQDQVGTTELARRYGIESLIEWHEHVSRDVVMTMLAQADASVLIRVQPGSVWITGKIWDYLSVPRPILALVDPASAAARIIRESARGVIAAPWDDLAVEAAIVELLDAIRADDSRAVVSGAMEPVLMPSIARAASAFLDSVTTR